MIVKNIVPLRWIARLSSIATGSVFLVILVLEFTNEDQPQFAAVPLLTLLVLTLVSSFAAWRWEKAGGVAIIIGAVGTSIAAFSSSVYFGLGSLSFLTMLIYGVPFLIVGILFLIASQHAMTGSTA
jgi:hypothetical protein